MAFLKNNQTASKPAVFKVWYKIDLHPRTIIHMPNELDKESSLYHRTKTIRLTLL